MRDVPPEFIRCSEIASGAIFVPDPNATSPPRVHGGSNATVRCDMRQSSRGISVTIADLVRVEPASNFREHKFSRITD